MEREWRAVCRGEAQNLKLVEGWTSFVVETLFGMSGFLNWMLVFFAIRRQPRRQ